MHFSINFLILATCARFCLACTQVIVPSPKGSVIARSMELAIPDRPFGVLQELGKIHFYPRGTNVTTLKGNSASI